MKFATEQQASPRNLKCYYHIMLILVLILAISLYSVLAVLLHVVQMVIQVVSILRHPVKIISYFVLMNK